MVTPEFSVFDDSFQQRIPLGQLGALIRNPQALPHDLRVRVLEDLAELLDLGATGQRPDRHHRQPSRRRIPLCLFFGPPEGSTNHPGYRLGVGLRGWLGAFGQHDRHTELARDGHLKVRPFRF
ncbi:hypothetical protein D3C85_1572280 [compost metagenome]